MVEGFKSYKTLKQENAPQGHRKDSHEKKTETHKENDKKNQRNFSLLHRNQALATLHLPRLPKSCARNAAILQEIFGNRKHKQSKEGTAAVDTFLHHEM
jgi:hypothetical protein